MVTWSNTRAHATCPRDDTAVHICLAKMPNTLSLGALWATNRPEMRRLRERQIVHLARPAGDGRNRMCCVLTVDGPSAALYLIAHDAREGQSPDGDHYLAFEHDGRPVWLRGYAQAVDERDIRFAPNAGVQLSRRSATRLLAKVPFEVSAADGEPVTATTIDYSADGALLEDPGLAGVDAGSRVTFSFAPDAGEPISGTAAVVRRGAGRLALNFQGLEDESRRRIIEHVISTKRAELEADVQRELASRSRAA